MGHIIDITKRLKSRNQSEKNKKAKPAEVVDMTQARTEKINSERRVVKRTIMNEFIGAFAIVPEKGLLKVSLHDISEKGVSFNIEGSMGYFRQNQEIAMRVYLNHKTYFPFVVKLRNQRYIVDEEVTRVGADFIANSVNNVALHHFIKFIENVSATLKTDTGDIQVSQISGS
jgi:hypothetical protein